MQHKRQRSKVGFLLLLLVGAILGTAVVLAFKDITPKAVPVEKELDAKTFLDAKQ